MENFQVTALARKKERVTTRFLWIATVVMLLAALIIAVAWIPVAYVIQSPGPTVNVLGSQGETPVLELAQSGQVSGGQGEAFVIPADGGSEGELLMVTVSSLGAPGTTTRIGNVVAAWFSRGDTIVRYSDLYAPQTTAEDVSQAGAAQMESSHSAASIAALEYLGVPMDTTMIVAGFAEGSGAAKVLKEGDILVSITAVDQVVHPVDTPSVPFRLMEVTPPGSTVKVTVLRDGEELTVDVPTMSASAVGMAPTDVEDEGEETGSRMGIYLSADTDLPLDVTIHLERIGGPSAGLAFALGIVDELTPGGIMGPDVVAATGALDFSGNVLAIGGVKQKMYGAVRDGAKWFLVPQDNCDAVIGNAPDGLRVVPVATLAQGAAAVEAISQGETDSLARCDVVVQQAKGSGEGG